MGSDANLVRRGTIASVTLLVLFLAAWEWGPGLLNIPTFIVPPYSFFTSDCTVFSICTPSVRLMTASSPPSIEARAFVGVTQALTV